MFTTVVINLDRDTDRLSFIGKQLRRQGLSFTRFPAILGTALPDAMRAYFSPEEDGTGFLSPGEIGCYASHLSVYEAIADGRISSPALVIEDDVGLPVNLAVIVEDILAAAPVGWDFIRLATPAKRAYFTVADLPMSHALVRYSMSSGSNAAMLVSALGARKFIDRSIQRSAPIDQDNRCVWRFGLDVLGVVPGVIRAVVSEQSSIDDLASGRRREDYRRQAELRAKRDLGRRHAWNIKRFGFAAWAASELVSAMTSLIAKKQRPAFLARAGVWLQSIAQPAREAVRGPDLGAQIPAAYRDA